MRSRIQEATAGVVSVLCCSSMKKENPDRRPEKIYGCSSFRLHCLPEKETLKAERTRKMHVSPLQRGERAALHDGAEGLCVASPEKMQQRRKRFPFGVVGAAVEERRWWRAALIAEEDRCTGVVAVQPLLETVDDGQGETLTGEVDGCLHHCGAEVEHRERGIMAWFASLRQRERRREQSEFARRQAACLVCPRMFAEKDNMPSPWLCSRGESCSLHLLQVSRPSTKRSVATFCMIFISEHQEICVYGADLSLQICLWGRAAVRCTGCKDAHAGEDDEVEEESTETTTNNGALVLPKKYEA